MRRYPLCSYCLGRLFAGLAHGLGNKARGDSLKSVLTMEADRLLREGGQPDAGLIQALASSGWEAAKTLAARSGLPFREEKCPLCMNRLREEVFNDLAERIHRCVEGFEFDSFVVGSVSPHFVKALEEKIFSEFSLAESEDVKKEVSREVGRRLESRLGKPVKFIGPQMTILVDVYTGSFEVRPSPLYIEGRYLKHVGGIPQTPWLCRRCWGLGCEACEYRGRELGVSVAEVIALPALKSVGALGYRFHAAGREDIDATVEGTGRPFILELLSPRFRSIDAEEYAEQVRELSGGRIEVVSPRISSRARLRTLKSSSERSLKRYRVVIEFDDPVSEDELRELEAAFSNRLVEQWTPRRVLGRRGDRLRKRRVYEVRARRMDEKRIELELLTDGGLYVKELIHGDEGRTSPAMVDVIGSRPRSIQLTVLAVLERRDAT